MVIIKKPIAKRLLQTKSKKPFVKVLAVVLTLVMMAATFAVAIPVISAKQCESYFTHQETIYIDLTQFTSWENDGAKIRVYTYYGDSNDDWNVENNNADSACNTNACYNKAIVPTSVSSHLYSFNIQGDKVGYVKVMRLDSGMNTCWSSTGYMYNDNRSGSQNCIKITGWDNAASWTTYIPSGGSGYQEVNAKPDATTITNNANIFPIDATFYDYYTDTEVSQGWGNINYVNSHGDWEPYTTLNNKIAAASSGVNYPMYFGNFFDKEDDYTGAGSSNMVHFSNWVNNSARLDGTHKSVVGLTGTQLVDGNLKYAGDNGTTSSVNVPFFDKSFLQTNNVGAVVNTKFPMRKVTDNGVTTYVFDSDGAKDNAWFSADKETMYYGAGTSKGAKDALYYYSNPQTASGYGFFPMDSNRGTKKEALNFAFGMRVDVPFNLGGDTGHYGQIKGTNGSYVDQKFTFTGDDDVWVYIDGKLVLDLGGDHQKAKGTINFAGGRGNGTVSVETGTNTVNNATRNTNFSIVNYDPTVEHTLTMFYVERGMVESNLSFDFNFAPIGNELIVDKTVDAADVNNSDTFKAAVKAAETFSFNQPTANGKTSTKGVINNSTYTLKDDEAISFKDQFTVPTEMIVNESIPDSTFSYTTSWKAVDLVLKNKGKTETEYTIGSDSGTRAEFTYKTKDTSSDFVMTRVQLSYTNTPAVASVNLKKVVTGATSDTTAFNGIFSVNLLDGNGWKQYPLKYKIKGSTTEYTMTDDGRLASNARLMHNRTLVIEGIPQGAMVRFKEDTPAAGYSFVSVTGGTSGITVGATGNDLTVTNKKLSGGGTIYVSKTLDDETYDGNQFSFTAEGVTRSGYVKGATATANSVQGGTVSFNLSFTQPGDYIYKITEDNLSADLTNKGYHKSNATIYAKFTVAAGADGLAISGDPVYYSDAACTTQASAVFNNTTEHAKITVNKEDPAGDPIKDTVFAVVKVKDETPLSKEQINYLIQNDSEYYTTGTTKADGTVEFADLPVFQNGDLVFNNTAAVGSPDRWIEGDNYYNGVVTNQTYLVFEFSPTDGYNTNNTTKFVTFPYESNYSVTFDYTNVAVIDPASGGSGMQLFLIIGFGVFGTGLLMAAAYVLYDRRVRAARRARHGKRFK